MGTLKYITGMKYSLSESFSVQTPVKNHHIEDKFFILMPDGLLHVHPGFCWDGASGPTIDTQSCIAASLVHDVFCICMRDGRISYDDWQDTINLFFKEMCIANGMPPWRAAIWHIGVEIGDAGNPRQGRDRIVCEAPL